MKNGLYVLVCSSLLVSGLEVLRFGYYKSQKDARILAKEWLDDNVPANTKILTDIVVNSLPLESSNLNLQGEGAINPPRRGAGGYLGKYIEYMEFLKNKNLDPYSEQFIKITRHLEQIKKYNVSEYDFPVNSKLANADSRGLIKPLSYYIDNGYKYVILGTFGILSKNTDPRCEPYRNFYAELESKGKLIKNFPQENLVFFQYHLFPIAKEVRIYKIGNE